MRVGEYRGGVRIGSELQEEPDGQSQEETCEVIEIADIVHLSARPGRQNQSTLWGFSKSGENHRR